MPKSINKTDKKLERFIDSIETSGDAMKIICHDVRANVEGSLFDSEPLPENCPSRAAAAEFSMRRLKIYFNDITALTNDLETHIYENYSDKK